MTKNCKNNLIDSEAAREARRRSGEPFHGLISEGSSQCVDVIPLINEKCVDVIPPCHCYSPFPCRRYSCRRYSPLRIFECVFGLSVLLVYLA